MAAATLVIVASLASVFTLLDAPEEDDLPSLASVAEPDFGIGRKHAWALTSTWSSRSARSEPSVPGHEEGSWRYRRRFPR